MHLYGADSGFIGTDCMSGTSTAQPEFQNKYKLQEAVVLSRHNIRAPLSDSKSALGRMTPLQTRG